MDPARRNTLYVSLLSFTDENARVFEEKTRFMKTRVLYECFTKPRSTGVLYTSTVTNIVAARRKKKKKRRADTGGLLLSNVASTVLHATCETNYTMRKS